MAAGQLNTAIASKRTLWSCVGCEKQQLNAAGTVIGRVLARRITCRQLTAPGEAKIRDAKMQTILGANGQVAMELVRELRRGYTSDLTQVSRKPRKVNDTDMVRSADLLDARQTAEAVKGSSIVYFTAGLPPDTRLWETRFPTSKPSRSAKSPASRCATTRCERSSGLPMRVAHWRLSEIHPMRSDRPGICPAAMIDRPIGTSSPWRAKRLEEPCHTASSVSGRDHISRGPRPDSRKWRRKLAPTRSCRKRSPAAGR